MGVQMTRWSHRRLSPWYQVLQIDGTTWSYLYRFVILKLDPLFPW